MDNQVLFEKLSTQFPKALLGSADRFGQLEIQVDRLKIADVVKTLRDEPEFGFNMLIDIVSIDYSVYPGWTGDRFGLVYHLKSLGLGHRAWLKVTAPEEEPTVPTVSHLYGNANWLEREAFWTKWASVSSIIPT